MLIGLGHYLTVGAILFTLGVMVMVAFINAARRVEPFVKRA